MNWSTEWGKIKSTEGDALEWKTFTFKDGHKARSIDVIIVGDLGLDFDNNGWNIYHIPTLSCFSKAVPSYSKPMEDQFKSYSKNEIICELSYDYSRDDLLNWMKKVQENYPTSWQMLRLLTPENFKDKGDGAKEIIQKWCLSVRLVKYNQ